MFHKEAPKETDDSIISKVNQDMIVHNMPDAKRLVGDGFLNKIEPSSGFQMSAPKKNFKTVGIFIMVGGLIVIGALIYLSYTFIIKPGTNNNSLQSKTYQTPVKAKEVIPVSIPAEVINVNTSTLVATSVPIDLASSSISTSSLDTLNGSTTEQIAALLDSDNDGLYDEEEVALGLNPNLADSDLDTYSDKSELDNGYNPNGVGKLDVNSALVLYSNSELKYEILHPISWVLKEVLADKTVLFTAPDDSIIQVSVSDNPSQLNINSWYSDAFSGSALTADRIIAHSTWDGVISEDRMNYYISDKKHQRIYIVSYLPIVNNRLAFPSLFKAMVNSIILK